MGTEIERKFLVRGDAWRGLAPGVPYRQGYLDATRGCVVRVRMAGERAFLTIKGPSTGLSRAEYEYEIPPADGQAMLDSLAEKPLIEKMRYAIPVDGLVWEVDEFCSENEGLIVAEVELATEEQEFQKPCWIGEEVTGDPRYLNASLVKHPFSRW